MRLFKYKKLWIYLLLFGFCIAAGCGTDLPEIKTIEKSYTLIDQDSSRVIFPDDYTGNIIVAGFIFTNCPDICPMTIHNMALIQKKISDEGMDGVEFTAISFDPLRDTPAVLKKTAELRSIDTKNYHFLTGKQNEIDSLLSVMNIYAFTDDTTYTKSGDPVYFFVHTDRISLIDQQGVLRAEYSGSRVKIDDIINDIKKLRNL